MLNIFINTTHQMILIFIMQVYNVLSMNEAKPNTFNISSNVSIELSFFYKK